MKLVSFLKNGQERTGLVSDGKVFDIQMLHAGLPDNMREMLDHWTANSQTLLQISSSLSSPANKNQRHSLNRIDLLAMYHVRLPLRDGYAFRQHVETARRNRS